MGIGKRGSTRFIRKVSDGDSSQPAFNGGHQNAAKTHPSLDFDGAWDEMQPFNPDPFVFAPDDVWLPPQVAAGISSGEQPSCLHTLEGASRCIRVNLDQIQSLLLSL